MQIVCVENILQSALGKEGHSHWAKELDKVAYMENTTLHTVLNNTPYKVLNGRDPPRGLRDFDIPSSLHFSINSVEDISNLFPKYHTLSDDEGGAELVEKINSPCISNGIRISRYMDNSVHGHFGTPLYYVLIA